jgi:hypothetical protein
MTENQLSGETLFVLWIETEPRRSRARRTAWTIVRWIATLVGRGRREPSGFEFDGGSDSTVDNRSTAPHRRPGPSGRSPS